MSRAANPEAIVIELNPAEQRLYDRLRAGVIEPVPGASSGLRDLLLLLPDLFVLLVRLMRDDRVPRVPKLVALLGVGYAAAPVDLLPVLFFGPLGLVDDLIVVGAALSHLLARVHPDIVRGHWSGQGDALDAIHRVSAWSGSLVSGRLGRLFSRS